MDSDVSDFRWTLELGTETRSPVRGAMKASAPATKTREYTARIALIIQAVLPWLNMSGSSTEEATEGKKKVGISHGVQQEMTWFYRVRIYKELLSKKVFKHDV